MGETITRPKQIVLLADVRLQPSNSIATNSDNFDLNSTQFDKGTIFQDFGVGDGEKYPLHGWCYKKITEKGGAWDYCNYHAYILDYWNEHKDLFNIYD